MMCGSLCNPEIWAWSARAKDAVEAQRIELHAVEIGVECTVFTLPDEPLTNVPRIIIELDPPSHSGDEPLFSGDEPLFARLHLRQPGRPDRVVDVGEPSSPIVEAPALVPATRLEAHGALTAMVFGDGLSCGSLVDDVFDVFGDDAILEPWVGADYEAVSTAAGRPLSERWQGAVVCVQGGPEMDLRDLEAWRSTVSGQLVRRHRPVGSWGFVDESRVATRAIVFGASRLQRSSPLRSVGTERRVSAESNLQAPLREALPDWHWVLSHGKYTRWAAGLTLEEVGHVLWQVGELGMRMHHPKVRELEKALAAERAELGWGAASRLHAALRKLEGFVYGPDPMGPE